MLIAKCINNIDPITDKPIPDLEVGKEYVVDYLSMGQSHTTVQIDFGNRHFRHFNSIHFDFYENGRKKNIYNSKKYNPYS